MANEISLASGLTASKGGVNISQVATTKTVDMTGSLMNDGVTTAVTGSWTVIEMGSLTTGADYWAHLQNLDQNNFVKVSTDNGTTEPFLVPPGAFWGPCKIKSGITVYVRANSADCAVATSVCAA